jgi:hypothetical protein
MKRATAKQKAGAIRYWKARKRRYDFARRHLYRILALDIEGWPHMTGHPYYLTWLDLVYDAKDRGLYSLKTSNCDVIANLYYKAIDLIMGGDT